MPANVEEIFAISQARVGVLWSIALADKLSVNCHFFDPSEIEFDFDPREVVDQEALEQVTEFVRVIGRSLRRAVIVCVEALEPRPEAGDMRYDPALDSVVIA